jgi:hypothetical protein
MRLTVAYTAIKVPLGHPSARRYRANLDQVLRKGENLPVSIHPLDDDVRQENVRSYISSSVYDDDLAATRFVWELPTLVATAGAYIFLLYLSVPELLGVSPGNGRLARSVLDGENERVFLAKLTGMTRNAKRGDGIRDPRVRRQARLLGDRHASFGGMRPCYLDFIGTVTTLAPLEVRAELNAPVGTQRQDRYWRYMSNAMSLLRSSIGHEAGARDRSWAFIDAHAATSAIGSQMYAALRARHPRHVQLAVPMLPVSAQVVVADLARSAEW